MAMGREEGVGYTYISILLVGLILSVDKNLVVMVGDVFGYLFKQKVK